MNSQSMKPANLAQVVNSLEYLTVENLKNAYIPIKLNGKFYKQIKLGDSLISQLTDITYEIDWLKNLSCALNYRIDVLTYKINSLLSEELKFSILGLTDSNTANVEANLRQCFTKLNTALASYIYDFENNMVSGDPAVWHDQLLFLNAIYLRIKNIDKICHTASNRQYAEIEEKIKNAMFLFNKSIDSLSWNQCFNQALICQTFGFNWQSFGYALETFLENWELKKLKFDYQEIQIPLIDS